MKEQYTELAKAVLKRAEAASRELKMNYVGSEHLLMGLIREKDCVASRILTDNGVDEDRLLGMIPDMIEQQGTLALMDMDGFSPRAEEVLEEAHRQAARFKAHLTGTEHLLLALLKDQDSVGLKLMLTMNVNVQKIYAETLAAMGEDPNLVKEDLKQHRHGKGKGSMLARYSRDLTALAAEGKLDPVIGRETEIMRAIQILSRRMKNNPCLIGEPGVGKTAVVEGLAGKIASGDVPATVRHARLLTLDISGMVAGSKYRGEFEERIKKVIQEVKDDPNIILFVDEMHTLIGAGGAEGSIDASNILKPSLSRGELQMIGATTITEYRKYVEKDAALERRFQPVMLEEPTREEAVAILKGIAHKYEEHHHVTISEEAILAAVDLSTRYINDRNLPDKAIDLIDEASSAVRLRGLSGHPKWKEIEEEIRAIDAQVEEALRKDNMEEASALNKKQTALLTKLNRLKTRVSMREAAGKPVVTESEIETVVAGWTKIPVQKIAEKESARLLKLDKELHKRVIGQHEAVEAVTKAIRRGRVGLQDPNRPIGSFLFLGPTGVGKTELSKALAEAVFGEEDALIRVDMSEYMEGHSVSKMIGSPPGYVGYDEGGQLSEKVRRHPYSVILFDEIEKAHPDVFNVLLQVLDDGHITDAKGRKVSFKNTILIMTSNVGAQRIVAPKNLGFLQDTSVQKDYERMKDGVMEEVKRLFKPEFINRIDEIMVFHQLTREEMMQIVTLLANTFAKRCKEQLDIDLTMSAQVKKYLVDTYADEKMGARPLKRAMQSVVEDAMAEALLKGDIVRGGRVEVVLKNKEIAFVSVKEKAKPDSKEKNAGAKRAKRTPANAAARGTAKRNVKKKAVRT